MKRVLKYLVYATIPVALFLQFTHGIPTIAAPQPPPAPPH